MAKLLHTITTFFFGSVQNDFHFQSHLIFIKLSFREISLFNFINSFKLSRKICAIIKLFITNLLELFEFFIHRPTEFICNYLKVLTRSNCPMARGKLSIKIIW